MMIIIVMIIIIKNIIIIIIRTCDHNSLNWDLHQVQRDPGCEKLKQRTVLHNPGIIVIMIKYNYDYNHHNQYHDKL